MRKYIRYMLRKKAEKMGVKASQYVSKEFNKIQIKKYGYLKRKINQLKGTHKRKAWKNRINFAF